MMQTDPEIKALGNRLNNLEQGLIMYASVLYQNKLLNAGLITSLPKYMRHRIIKALDMQKNAQTINDPELKEWSKL